MAIRTRTVRLAITGAGSPRHERATQTPQATTASGRITSTNRALWSRAASTSPWARLAAARVAPQNGQSKPVSVRQGHGVGPASPIRSVAAVSQAAPTPASTAAGPSMFRLRWALAVEMLTLARVAPHLTIWSAWRGGDSVDESVTAYPLHQDPATTWRCA